MPQAWQGINKNMVEALTGEFLFLVIGGRLPRRVDISQEFQVKKIACAETCDLVWKPVRPLKWVVTRLKGPI